MPTGWGIISTPGPRANPEHHLDPWSEGYVSDIDYTFGYYPELNPLRLRLALLFGGLVVPEVSTACELGFGQGLSVNVHAAASTVQWHGTDFNPAQAGMAQELASASGAGARLHDASFAEFCARSDLPDFDFIGLHGIWSWVSEDNRRILVDFLRRKLKVGGVVYISYNTLPGWSTAAPLRKLLTDHAAALSDAEHGPVGRIDAALAAVDKLMAVNPAWLALNPEMARRFEQLKSHSRSYLAHEYFNRDWQPMYFSDMAAALSQAKLSHAGSAAYLDHIDALNLTEPQQALLAPVQDPVLRQTLRDFIGNRQFRQDYWIKGPRKLAPFDQAEALRQQRVVLTTHRPDVPLQCKSQAGDATLDEAIYGPLLDSLADHQPRTLGQIEAALANRGIAFALLLQAVLVMVGLGRLEPAQDPATVAQARPRTDRLNQHLIQRARGNSDIAWLLSPVTGGAVPVQRVGQLCLLARTQGLMDPQAWATFSWNILSAQGHAVIKDGKLLESAEDNLEELRAQARAFAEQRLPVLQALRVV